VHYIDQIVFEVPDDVRLMIEAQLERPSEPEQSASELASVAGASFDARTQSETASSNWRASRGDLRATDGGRRTRVGIPLRAGRRLAARAAGYGLIDVQVRDLRVPTSVCE
jgi:hypothetical protein